MDNADFISNLDKYQKERDRTIKSILGRFIKSNFLIEMKYQIIDCFPDLLQYYDFQLSMEKLVIGHDANYDFDICKLIVGCHNSNIVFMSDDERIKLEKSSKYKQQLAAQVIDNIKIRQYSSRYFRNLPIMYGELFAYYNTPYNLFAISMRMKELLVTRKITPEFFFIYKTISDKALSTLSLLGDNFLDNCYPICRVIIELYLKLLVLKGNTGIINEYEKFSEFEIRQSCCEQEYPTEFNKLYLNRTNKSMKKKIDYLHYGWVDYISEYHSIVIKQPYSINGIMYYLQETSDNTEHLSRLEILFKMCHGYVHGNVTNSKYPLLHYFEISSMLYYTVFNTYKILCSEVCDDGTLNGVDIIVKTQNDFSLLHNQYIQHSTENFESHYKKIR